jgi:ATP-dependent RNA helicase DeaD
MKRVTNKKENMLKKFRDLGLSDTSIKALEKKGFEEPTEIQQKTIPILLKTDKDIIAQAQTGTGKTAAFGLVFTEKLIPNAGHIQAIVLAPTRELAVQVAEEINSLKGTKNLRIIPIYGGQSMSLQHRELKRGADVIIGTPGRVMDHLRQKTMNLSKVKYAVLDEADEMLNMGFVEDMETILKETNPLRQTLLFSATMPSRIQTLAKKFMRDATIIKTDNENQTTHLVNQIYFEVSQSDKFEALCRIIDIEEEFYSIIFCRTKVDSDHLSQMLSDRGYSASAIHGDIAQKQRESILRDFKLKKTMILVATDVAARGIDVNNLSHVINYSLPQEAESYVHRIGRTGRAGKEGTAITFVTPDEYRRLAFIKKIAKTEIKKEKIPNKEEIITIKKNRIAGELKNIASTEDLTYYNELANSIIGEIDPMTAVAALLKYAFADKLDIDNYADIKELNMGKKESFSKNTKTRLFVTVGKKDKMTPKQLVDLIEKQAKVPQRFINNVEIYDSFSFINVSFEDAEKILTAFQNGIHGDNITVKKATERTTGGSDKRTDKPPRRSFNKSGDRGRKR